MDVRRQGSRMRSRARLSGIALALLAMCSTASSVAAGATGADGAGDAARGTPESVEVAPTPDGLHDGGWASVAVGSFTSCGIRKSGSLWCWGSHVTGEIVNADRPPYQPSRIAAGSDWLSVAPGAGHVCAIRRDHSLWCWGRNSFGQLGLGD